MRQVVLYPDHEDGGWVAEVPSLPGCVSEGDTREAALALIREAVNGWIDMARAHGDPVPEDQAEVHQLDVA